MGFVQLLDEIRVLHDRKQADYGRTQDPYANVRASEDFGIDPWVGAMVRANDKMRRLMKAAQGGDLVNESIRDSLLDLAVYTLIALDLYDEQHTARNDRLERKLAGYYPEGNPERWLNLAGAIYDPANAPTAVYDRSSFDLGQPIDQVGYEEMEEAE